MNDNSRLLRKSGEFYLATYYMRAGIIFTFDPVGIIHFRDVVLAAPKSFRAHGVEFDSAVRDRPCLRRPRPQLTQKPSASHGRQYSNENPVVH